MIIRQLPRRKPFFLSLRHPRRYNSSLHPSALLKPINSSQHASANSDVVPSSEPLPTARYPAYIPAPLAKSGPLLARRPDRDLPNVDDPHIWLKTLPPFIALMVVASLWIFNYQKSHSPVINSILYALRMSEEAREVLGDGVYFASKYPWIRGEMNQLHGRIDVWFYVKGSKGTGKVSFVSRRKKRKDPFRTEEWSLETEDGRVLQLLDLEQGDPFRAPPR